MQHGADAIRINPGNIPAEGIRQIVKVAKKAGKVIRIGINAGSLEKEIAGRHGGPTAEALVESALKNIRLLEEMDFDAIKLSLKSSDVATTIEAYRLISEKTDYPLHLGVTEAGTLLQAAIKSAIGIGTLLYDGIGDTIRVSVTGRPVPEMIVAYGILRALEHPPRRSGYHLLSDLRTLRDRSGRVWPSRWSRNSGDEGPLEDRPHGLRRQRARGGRRGGYRYCRRKRGRDAVQKGKVVRKIREEEFVPVLLEEIGK